MKDLWNDSIKIQLQHFVPVISSFILIIIFMIPSYPFVSNTIRPSVSLICVYYWLTTRPDIFGLTYTFIISLFEDIISTAPAGTNIFSALILYLLTMLIYKYISNKPFNVSWFGFGLISFATLLAKWLISSIYYSQFLSFSNVFFCYLMSVAFYPVFSIINYHLQQSFMQESR